MTARGTGAPFRGRSGALTAFSKTGSACDASSVRQLPHGPLPSAAESVCTVSPVSACPSARRPARLRHPAHRDQRRPARPDGYPPPQSDQHDHGRLYPRRPGHPTGSDQPHGQAPEATARSGLISTDRPVDVTRRCQKPQAIHRPGASSLFKLRAPCRIRTDDLRFTSGVGSVIKGVGSGWVVLFLQVSTTQPDSGYCFRGLMFRRPLTHRARRKRFGTAGFEPTTSSSRSQPRSSPKQPQRPENPAPSLPAIGAANPIRATNRSASLVSTPTPGELG